MAKEKVDLRKELRSYKFEFNLLQKNSMLETGEQKLSKTFERGQDTSERCF